MTFWFLMQDYLNNGQQPVFWIPTVFNKYGIRILDQSVLFSGSPSTALSMSPPAILTVFPSQRIM